MMEIFAEKKDCEEDVIASALTSEADIPSVSSGFASRCLAAMRFSRADMAHVRRLRGFKFAASMAAIVAIVTWAATVAAMKKAERCGRSVEDRKSASVGDVSALGVVSSQTQAIGAASISNESVVNANPGATVLWKALNAGQAQMGWEWPECALSARLTITGGGIVAEKLYGKSDAFPVWNPPVPDDFCEDDVFTAKLTFYKGERGEGGEVACLVAEGIGFVRGVSGVGAHFAFDGSQYTRVVKK